MKKILIAGGTGLIGAHLSQLLKNRGYQVAHLSRRANPNAEFPTYAWQPETGDFDKKAFDEAHAIINLAGAGIADKLWSEKRKREIIESRALGNHLIANYLRSNKHSIQTYISASAIGFYGDRGNELMTENSPAGMGFLAESTTAWENAIAEVAATNIRTVALRIGVVLTPRRRGFAKNVAPVYGQNGNNIFCKAPPSGVKTTPIRRAIVRTFVAATSAMAFSQAMVLSAKYPVPAGEFSDINSLPLSP